MIFRTSSGSVYEVDAPRSRMRPCSPADAPWREYISAIIKMNKPAVFFWPGKSFLPDGSPMGAVTHTSLVVEVDHVKDVQDAALRK
jgi:hypothetical protein